MERPTHKRQDHLAKENKILKVIEMEYHLFKYEMLSRTRSEIYDNCNLIHFYECLWEYFLYMEKMELEFVWKVKLRDHLMGELYHYYLKTEYLSVETWSGIEELLRCYVAGVVACVGGFWDRLSWMGRILWQLLV